jgi:hypothetical protein
MVTVELLHCRLIDEPVRRVVDFEGSIRLMICPAFDLDVSACRVRQRAVRGTEPSPDRASTACLMLGAPLARSRRS